MNDRHVAALGALFGALTACSGDMRGTAPPGPPSNVAGSGNSGGSISGGSGGAGGSTSGGTSGTGGSDCVLGIPVTSQIPRLARRQYDAVVRDLLGVTTLASAGNQPPSTGLYADFDGPVNVDVWRLYYEVAGKIAAEVLAGPNRSTFIACDPAVAGCLTETVRTFGRKAFRRPLTEAEVQRFEALGRTTPPPTPQELVDATLHAFLVSPSFLQITELTTEAEGSAFKLSSYEVAARLSFLIWGSVPDDMLNAAADAGELATREQIFAQAQRMVLVRDKTAPLIAAMHRAYLDMENEDSHWWKVSHDTTKFPRYTDSAVPALQAELDRFFEDQAFGGGSFEDLFLSNIGYVNKDSAAIYGLDPAAFGTELTRVELDPARRPGFLTRAGFLSSFSHFDGTSPILRGAFITVNILGVNPGAPDPNFFLTPPPTGTFDTERAYIEALTSQASCTGCHTPYINPPGFALENYDSIGAWQDVDPRGGPINPTATVTFSETNVNEVTTPLALMQEISRTPLAKRIYAEKVVSFATGRLPNPNDACSVDTIDLRLSQEGYTILNLLTDLTQTDSFRLRVRGN
jgi:hypothetical protein